VNGARRPAEALHETVKPSSAPESVALLLQGSGALGSYQAGVYQALLERGIEPTWIAGISIGAINSAIIAGNSAGDRLAKLRAFWETVSDAGDNGWSDRWAGHWQSDRARGWINRLAAGRVIAEGVRGFFTPRIPPPYLLPAGTAGVTSYYDVTGLWSTLERLIDFDRINAKAMRFSVGAVNVRTGNFAYFDNKTDMIRPEHIMASCALPPAFDAIEVDGEFYWDGGMVSNTPLDWVISERTDLDTLVPQVDLWSARGSLPRDLAEVAVRMKEVQFSSRTRAASDEFRKVKRLQAAFNELLKEMSPELAATPQAQLLARACEPAVYNVVQLVYRSATYEASRRTMSSRGVRWRNTGRRAMTTPPRRWRTPRYLYCRRRRRALLSMTF